MATIIKEKKLATDPWLRLEAAADGAAPAIPAQGDVIVPLAVWQAERETLLARIGGRSVGLQSASQGRTGRKLDRLLCGRRHRV